MEKSLDSFQIIEKISESNSLFQRFFKRLMDIFASFLGLLFLSPVFLLIAIAMHRDSPGPIFYGGPRLGRGGKEFIK